MEIHSDESKSGGNKSGDVEDVEGTADVTLNPRTEFIEKIIGQYPVLEDLALYALNVDPSISPPTPEVKQILSSRKIPDSVKGEDFVYGIGKTGKYRGNTVNGKASGLGELTFENKDTWKGQFFNGMMHGEGFYSSGNNEKVYMKMIQNHQCVLFKGEVVHLNNPEEADDIKQYLKSMNLEIGILSKHLKEILEIKENQTIELDDGLYKRYEGGTFVGYPQGRGKVWLEDEAILEGQFMCGQGQMHGNGELTKGEKRPIVQSRIFNKVIVKKNGKSDDLYHRYEILDEDEPFCLTIEFDRKRNEFKFTKYSTKENRTIFSLCHDISQMTDG